MTANGTTFSYPPVYIGSQFMLLVNQAIKLNTTYRDNVPTNLTYSLGKELEDLMTKMYRNTHHQTQSPTPASDPSEAPETDASRNRVRSQVHEYILREVHNGLMDQATGRYFQELLVHYAPEIASKLSKHNDTDIEGKIHHYCSFLTEQLKLRMRECDRSEVPGAGYMTGGIDPLYEYVSQISDPGTKQFVESWRQSIFDTVMNYARSDPQTLGRTTIIRELVRMYCESLISTYKHSPRDRSGGQKWTDPREETVHHDEDAPVSEPKVPAALLRQRDAELSQEKSTNQVLKSENTALKQELAALKKEYRLLLVNSKI